MTIVKTVTRYKQYVIIKYTGTGTTTFYVPQDQPRLEYLVVAGGGGGGYNRGGGGGAGGLKTGTLVTKKRIISITVGAGGTGPTSSGQGGDGGNSVLDTITATGGGGGGNPDNASYYSGRTGGSGGGAVGGGGTGGSGTAGQGNNGGNGYNGGVYGAGGGGGAGAVGVNATSSTAGNGGAGIASSITGTSLYYGGGGGGGVAYGATKGTGGSSIGGNGGSGSTVATAGMAGRGAGGGGGSGDSGYRSGGAGGSGVVIIRYKLPISMPGYLEATGGELIIEDPIEITANFSASTDDPILAPPVSEATIKVAVSAPTTFYQCLIETTAKFAAKIVAKIFVNLATLNLEEITVSRNLQDRLWNCSATIDDYYGLDMTTLRNIQYSATDHLDVSHALFTGIVPQSTPVIEAARNKTPITGYDYAWYLTQRYVPTAYQHNTAATNPATVILGLLGGNDWATETGIEPFNIDTVAEWGTTLATRVFDFTPTTTRMQAIEKICAYCRYMFVVKWRDVGGGFYQPAAYFINETAIDTDLDLPAAVTITAPDSYLDGSVRVLNKGEERYNMVTVIGRDPAGTVYTKTEQSAGVTNGDEIPVEYIENSGAWTTQAQVNARALELYNLYIEPTKTYTATFRDRFDLEFLQKIKFVGFTATGVTEDWMRIISIKYRHARGCEKTVEIQFTTNVKFSDLQRMYRSLEPDPVSEAESIFDSKMAQVPTNEVGTVTAIDGNTATITLEDGRTVTARIII